MNELVKVDMSGYGLEETKAAEIRKDFDAVLKIAEGLESDYNAILAETEITKDVVKSAKALRLQYSKMRTGVEKVRKARKAFYLSGGKAVDGLAHAYTHAVSGNEAKLKEIETHFERIEKERLDKLQNDRAEKLAHYVDDASERDLLKFEDDEFEALLSMKKNEFEERIAAEKKTEADRLAKAKAEAEEQERIRKENDRLKKDAEDREAKAKAEQAKRERAEKERMLKEVAERKERARIEAERVAKERKERRKAEESARIEKERVEAEREKDRKEAQAKLDAERKERARIEAGVKAKADAEAKAKADADAREKNQKHRKEINNAALEAIMLAMSGKHAGNSDEAHEVAKLIVVAIAKGDIPNVKIIY